MRKFLKRQAAMRGATKIEQDPFGNLFITKGTADTYPCLAAHIDQVQREHSRDFRVVEIGDDVIGWSPKCHEQQGLGADDKNGIFICLECLRQYDCLKVAFFVGDEVGCVGSSRCDLSFFSDCRFIIEPDRRGADDLITDMCCGDVCSNEFVAAINAKQFGYSHNTGSITDVGELTERNVGISCLNLSCGYYNAHTSQEYTVLSELENCLHFVRHIIETCTDVYPFTGGRRSLYGYLYNSAYSAFQEDEDYEMMDSLISSQPDITFEDVAADWGINFHTRDYDILEMIYDDVKMWYDGKRAANDDDFLTGNTPAA